MQADRHIVLVCRYCRCVRRFGEWVVMEKKLNYALAKGDIIEDNSEVCPACQQQHGATNRLIPVMDKSEATM